MDGSLDLNSKLFDHGDEQRVLVFEMLKDYFDFRLGFDVHFQIIVGPKFRMPTLNILSDHYEGHEQKLNQIRNKQPKYEPHWRIKLQATRDKQIPGQPKYCPDKDDKKKPHRANALCDPASQPIQETQVAGRFSIDISEAFALFSQFS